MRQSVSSLCRESKMMRGVLKEKQGTHWAMKHNNPLSEESRENIIGSFASSLSLYENAVRGEVEPTHCLLNDHRDHAVGRGRCSPSCIVEWPAE